MASARVEWSSHRADSIGVRFVHTYVKDYATLHQDDRPAAAQLILKDTP
jgi:hypothetical protein